jgi:hypothetical protein
VRRLLCALLLLALIPATRHVTALATLAIIAGVLTALISYEAIRYAASRERVRHELARQPVGQ